MRPSKKKTKNRKSKPPITEGCCSSNPTKPHVQVQTGSSDTSAAGTETLGCSSSSQSRSSDLAWLSDAFSSLSVHQIKSAYTVAGCDAFKAAGILGTHLEEEALEQDRITAGPVGTEGPAQKKCRKARTRPVPVSCGMVSSVMGKRPHSEMHETDATQGGVESRNSEEAEQFLCSMLGEQSELGMGVVRDILGPGFTAETGFHTLCMERDVCRGDVEKALELLLQLSDSSYCPQIREQLIPPVRNSVSYSHIFGGMGWKKTPESNTSPYQLVAQASSLTNYPTDRDSGLLSVRPKMDGPRRSKSDIEQNVLESLFNLRETPEKCTNAPGSLDWRKIVRELRNGRDFELDMPATRQTPQAGKRDGYHEFRTVAQHNWSMMKTYYQRAALEYSRGNRSHATCLAEKGSHYRDLAREEDERASLEIFCARNQGIINTITVDLHGQHVKPAIGLLKRHLLSLACLPSMDYLRVITGCGEDGVGKGKMKRSVKNLAVREKLEWSEENSGTIKLTIKGRKEYTFTASDIDEE